MDEMASDVDLRKEIKTHVTTEAKSVMKTHGGDCRCTGGPRKVGVSMYRDYAHVVEFRQPLRIDEHANRGFSGSFPFGSPN